jgi:uncharacterized DUF497 family protein
LWVLAERLAIRGEKVERGGSCAPYVNHIACRMDIEYDADKDEANRFKHRLPLAFGARVFDDDDHVIVASFREEDDEDRYKAIGRVDGKLYTVVHVLRGDVVRLISVRRSNGSEEKRFNLDSG